MIELRLDVKVVEKTIGIPATKWSGKCHQIASALLKHNIVKGTLRYGYWSGDVALGSKFYRYPQKQIHHGWVELPDGTIVDPTRFEFEQKRPYIYIGPNDFYDAGGNKFREETMKPPPAFSFKQKCIELKMSDSCALALIKDKLERVAGADSVVITIWQAFWLANLSLRVLGEAARPIYLALIEAGEGGLIPFDNKHMVLDDEQK